MMNESLFHKLELQARLNAQQQHGLFALLATPLSWLYRFVVAARNSLYECGMLPAKRLPGTVISVGNIVAGGVGKSPSIAALSAHLVTSGHRPAIVTRGYGSGLPKRRCVVWLNGRVIADSHPNDGEYFADEAHMLSVELPSVPVVVGRRRYQAVQFALQGAVQDVTHWMLDDGFQHRGLARDLDVVLLSSVNPFGNQFLLPRGILREPNQNLRRADVVVMVQDPMQELQGESFMDSQGHDMVRHVLGVGVPIEYAVPKFASLRCMHHPAGWNPTAPIEKLAAITAIARPERFFVALARLGHEVTATRAYSDHQRLPVSDLLELTHQCHGIVTTCKDYWRDPALFARLAKPVYVLPMYLEMGAAEILSHLDKPK